MPRKAKTRINLTKKGIDGIPAAPEGKRVYVHDSHTRGLAVSVTDKGVKTFILYRAAFGKPERMFLGRYPDLSIEQARNKASEHAAAIAQGENPADKRRADRGEMTLQALFDMYLERHAKARKRTWPEDESKFKQYLASGDDGINLAVRKVSSIRKADIGTLHAKIGKAHPITANRVLALASSIFGRAIEWGLLEGANPCKGIRRFRENSRDRFIQGDELPRFFRALAAEPNEVMRDYFLLSLLTGARRSNVLGMKWEDVNLERGEWRIAATEMKAGTAHTVPLTPEAVEILRRREEASLNSALYVLPGPGKCGHLSEPKKAWKRVLKAAGLSDVRIHDLRRTMGSWQAATGASLAIIGKTLAHADVSTTAIYARLNIDPVRAAMETATKAMMAAGGVIPAAKVVSMAKAKAEKKAREHRSA